jgi:hypothetical protein
MGNQCPQGFQLSPSAPFSCVVECPKDKGFVFANSQSLPVCAYKEDQSINVKLKVVPAIRGEQGKPIPSIEQLQGRDPAAFQKFKEARDEFNAEFPIVYAKIEKDVALKNAFKQLQDAENARDKSPEGYQTARARYYTLLKGEGWATEEKERVARGEVDPMVAKFSGAQQDLQTRITQQQKTIDLMKGVKDKVLSIRDEFRYSVNTLGGQVEQVKQQIQMERKKQQQTVKLTSESTWMDIFLNVMLILVSLIVIFILYRKFTTPSLQPQPRLIGYN